MDVLTKKQRSRNMSAVRSRGNKSTEKEFIKLLKENRINGWKGHYKKLPGTPDFVFISKKLAVFIDGCFWHACKRHFKLPLTNKIFWKKKISNNTIRDRRVNQKLKKSGWKVLRFWEHQIKKNPERLICKIRQTKTYK